MTDFTPEEQEHVRAALRFLHFRMGGWIPLAKALGFSQHTIAHVHRREKAVTASLAVRLARVAAISIDDLVAGKYPPAGVCPYCGRPASEAFDGAR